MLSVTNSFTAYSDVIKSTISDNLQALEMTLGKSADFHFREIETDYPFSIHIGYFHGMASEDYINSYIVRPLSRLNTSFVPSSSSELLTYVKKKVLHSATVQEVYSLPTVIKGVLAGKTVAFLDGCNRALLIESQGFKTRNVEEPETEASVRGSREGFSEVLSVNTALLRRRIKNSQLIVQNMVLGKHTNTQIRLIYMENLVNKKVLHEVKQRLKNIDIDSVLESGYIEQYIEDHSFSIFPTIGNSEKPDKIAAKILEGRVAILCDGTPFALTVPQLFIENFQVTEDYYSRFYLASLLRIFRILSLYLTVLTPAIFVAISSFHQEMIPTLLITTIAASEEKVPFPIFVEALIMVVLFELLREAGLRMPRPVGSAITIVGALILGEAAVQAGIVSAPMVIVVALTAITGFIVTPLNDGIVISRLFLLFLAGLLGFYGIFIGILILLGHICSLRSFGTPYLAPLGPILLSEVKDSIVRMPLWTLNTKPKEFATEEFHHSPSSKQTQSSHNTNKDG
jgi:spore germination protein KA